MPGHLERHSRSRWEWGAPGSRSEELRRAVDDDPAGKSPGRKDPARCKANRGGPHVPEIALRDETPGDEFRCRWSPKWDLEERKDVVAWHCEHEERCAKCGLIFERFVGAARCPAYPGTPEQKAVAEREAFEWNERRRAMPARRKPAVKGRQGYRRRRG